MLSHQHAKITLLILIVALAACTSHPALEIAIQASTPNSRSPDPKAISPATASRVTQLTRQGAGLINGSYAWAQNLPRLAVASSAGVSIYDAAVQREIRFIETPGTVATVALSPDGQTLATGGEDKSLRLWDVSTGRLLSTLQEQASSLYGLNVVFSPDGQQLATTDGKVIRIRDLTTGHELQTWSVPGVWQITFVSDRVLAIRVGSPVIVSFWDVTTGQILTSFDTPATAVWTPDKVLLTANARDTAIELQELGTGRNRGTLQGSVKPEPFGLALSPDGKTLAVGDWNTIEIWDVSAGHQLRRIENLSAQCCLFYQLTFSPDGNLLALSAGDTIWLWDMATGGRELQRVLPGPGYAAQLAFIADRKRIVVRYDVSTGPHSSKAVIKILDVATGRELAVFDSSYRSLYVGQTSPSPALVAYGMQSEPGQDPDVVPVIDLSTGRQLPSLPHGYPVSVADNRLIAVYVGSEHSRLQVEWWNSITGGQLHRLEQNMYTWAKVEFSPDGQWLAMSAREAVNPWREVVQIWDVATGQRQTSLPTDSIAALAFAPDSKTLATAKRDGEIVFWEVATDSVSRTLNTTVAGVSAMSFSPDGRLLAVAGSVANRIHLWDVAAGHELLIFTGHQDEIKGVTFSPDGQVLASASSDRTIRLWEVAGGRELTTLPGHNDVVDKVVFSADGRHLVSGSYDGTVRMWGVP